MHPLTEIHYKGINAVVGKCFDDAKNGFETFEEDIDITVDKEVYTIALTIDIDKDLKGDDGDYDNSPWEVNQSEIKVLAWLVDEDGEKTKLNINQQKIEI